MKRLKTWLIKEFLPADAKDALIKEVKLLVAENEELKHKVAERDAYIEGLERGIRNQRRIIINTTTGGKQ